MSAPVPAVPGRQHVEILTSTSSTQAPAGYGTGYVIAPRLILTARHVVADASAIHVRLGIEPSGPRLPATIAWSGTAGVDLALLELAEPVPHPVRIPSFGQLLALPEADTTRRSWDYRCTGFPALQQEQLPDGGLYRDSVTIRGAIRLDWNLRTGLLTLAVGAIEGVESADWKGMSDSPVFIHDWLVGVVVMATRHKHTLSAVPIAAVLDDRARQH